MLLLAGLAPTSCSKDPHHLRVSCNPGQKGCSNILEFVQQIPECRSGSGKREEGQFSRRLGSRSSRWPWETLAEGIQDAPQVPARGVWVKSTGDSFPYHLRNSVSNNQSIILGEEGSTLPISQPSRWQRPCHTTGWGRPHSAAPLLSMINFREQHTHKRGWTFCNPEAPSPPKQVKLAGVQGLLGPSTHLMFAWGRR